MNAEYFEIMLELNAEKKALKALGLSEEEIEGYIDFYIDNWLRPVKKISNLKVATNAQN